MPVCIHCSTPIAHLYTNYSKADDRSAGRGVRLTQCPTCAQFADKYVEYDRSLLFIDLLLLRPEVYRHLRYNRAQRTDSQLDSTRSIVRLGFVVVLVTAYVVWLWAWHRLHRDESGTAAAGA